VKVLDVGLGNALASEAPATDPVSPPTLTMRARMAGVILGTAAYMAAEQARGHDADKRADIWLSAWRAGRDQETNGKSPNDGHRVALG
jgi:hypothetical protein